MISRVIESYHKAKEAQKLAGSPYQPAPMWKDFISLRQPLIDALDKKDEKLVGELLSNLFRNESGAFITDYNQWLAIKDGNKEAMRTTMDRIEREVRIWMDFTNYKYSLESLQLPNIGNPYGCYVNDIPLIPSAARYHYYVQKIKAMLDGVESPVVGEIGGGLGIIAYFLTQDSNVKYVGFDLPEILVMSQYYLMTAFPEKRFLLYGERPDEYITSDMIEKYDYVLMPNFMLPCLGNNSVDVFINFHSLSEVSPETIKEYIEHIARVSKSYFYHENAFCRVRLFDKYNELSERDFHIPDNKFVMLSMSPTMWGENIYREYIYKKRRYEVMA